MSNNPFDYVNSVSHTKDDIIGNSAIAENGYNSFIVNKSLSYHADCIFHVNLMNINYNIDKKLQYDYYLHSIPKKKRYGKWVKNEITHEIDCIMKIFECNLKKAREYHSCLKAEEIDQIVKACVTDGKKP